MFLDTLNNKCDDDEATACTTDADCVGAADIYASNDLCGHAGYRDWRLPHVDDDPLVLVLPELDGLIDLSEPAPKIFSVFKSPRTPGCTVVACSCAQSGFYWSSTTYGSDPKIAWGVGFYYGEMYYEMKFLDFYFVRAVRGGL